MAHWGMEDVQACFGDTADLNIPADCKPCPLMREHIVDASANRLGIDVDTILHGIHQTSKRHSSRCIHI